MRKLIFITLFLLSSTIQAQKFYTAKIIMNDGMQKSGFATLPVNGSFNKPIKFKSSKDGSAHNINNNDISGAIYTSDSGNEYLFERIVMIYINKSFDEQKNGEKCDSSKKNWALVTSYSKNIMSYYLAQKYIIEKNGKLVSKTSNTGTWADIFILFRRPNESCASMIGHIAYGAKIIGQEKKFRNVASEYFKDKPELVKRIKNKEFKSNEFQKLINAYNSYF
jgi:hypothetical protein